MLYVQNSFQLETFAILAEIQIVAGIVISITLAKMLSGNFSQMIIALICGWFVWGFGLLLRVKIRKAIISLEEN
ncbi:MAG: hypothetical protein IJ252_04380 [Solobacterium sp.]|nr:hypothetical protein [Solobacterium sp.]